MTQVKLLRKVSPDDDDDLELLRWLARRGFHDVVAVTTVHRESGAKSSKSKKGVDLAIWVDDERIAREQINLDPKHLPKPASALSAKERALCVQAAMALLTDAKRMRVITFKKCFMLHTPKDLAEIARKRHSFMHNILWDAGNELEDSTAEYFGTKVGFYVAWMRFYTLSLIAPTLAGIYVAMKRRQQAQLDLLSGTSSIFADPLASDNKACSPADSTFSVLGGAAGGDGFSGSGGGGDSSFCNVPSSWLSPILPLFNVFLAVWATLFMEFWKRKQSRLAYRWGVHRAEEMSRALRLITWDGLGPRSTHLGTSGRRVTKMRSSRSLNALAAPAAAVAAAAGAVAWGELFWTLRMMVSVALELVLLGLSVAVMLWFNHNIVHANERYGDRSWVKFLLRVLYAIVPVVGSALHKKWASFMTDWEAHVTPSAAEDVLIVKLTAFAMVNSYSAPFFIAFWERDLVRLREMLTTLLVTRAIFSRIMEVVVPIVAVGVKKSRQGRRTDEVRRMELMRAPEISCRRFEEENANDKQHARERLFAERYLDSVDITTEYLEQIIQYGYVTMFAVAFPLAPLLALLNNLTEYHLDFRKIVTSRRPPYETRSGIGAWYDVLEVVGTLSVLTNCSLLSLTAEGQVDQFIPESVAAKFPLTKHILFVVAAEHVLLAFKYLLAITIDDTPADIEQAMAQDLLAGHDEDRARMHTRLGLDADQTPWSPARVHHSFVGQRDSNGRRISSLSNGSGSWGNKSGSGSWANGSNHTVGKEGPGPQQQPQWVDQPLQMNGGSGSGGGGGGGVDSVLDAGLPPSAPPSVRSDISQISRSSKATNGWRRSKTR